jgi:hypothetical protein
MLISNRVSEGLQNKTKPHTYEEAIDYIMDVRDVV